MEGLHLNNLSVYSGKNETRPALGFDRVNNRGLFFVKADIRNPEAPLVHLRNVSNVTAKYYSVIGIGNTLFKTD